MQKQASGAICILKIWPRVINSSLQWTAVSICSSSSLWNSLYYKWRVESSSLQFDSIKSAFDQVFIRSSLYSIKSAFDHFWNSIISEIRSFLIRSCPPAPKKWIIKGIVSNQFLEFCSHLARFFPNQCLKLGGGGGQKCF